MAAIFFDISWRRTTKRNRIRQILCAINCSFPVQILVRFRTVLPITLMKLLLAFIVVTIASSPALAVRSEPQKQIDNFFRTLTEKGAAVAVDALCKGTLLESQKASQLVAAGPQLDALLKVYGKIARTETIEKKPFGESFVRVRVISYHAAGAPVFWEFMFFKATDEWQIYVFQFNDQFSKVFSNA